MHIASVSTTTAGRMLRFTKATWAGSRLPKRTALFCMEPLQSSEDAGRLNDADRNRGGSGDRWSRDRRSAPVGISDIEHSVVWQNHDHAKKMKQYPCRRDSPTFSMEI